MFLAGGISVNSLGLKRKTLRDQFSWRAGLPKGLFLGFTWVVPDEIMLHLYSRL